MDLSDLGKLGDLAKQMQDAYDGGLAAMNQASAVVSEDMNPDHEVKLDIELLAEVEGHAYHVDATVLFDIELNPVLEAANSPMGNLSSLLDGLGVDLGDDKDSVMKQLGQPRAVGVVKHIDLRDLNLSGEFGKLEAVLNVKGALLATITDAMMAFNCEGVFSYPDFPGCYAAIPSMAAMQENLVVPTSDLYKAVKFHWTETDKDGLRAHGTLKIRSL